MARKSSGPLTAGHYTADAVFIIDYFYTGLMVVALLLIRMVRQQRQRQYGLLSLVGLGVGSALWFSAPLLTTRPGGSSLRHRPPGGGTRGPPGAPPAAKPVSPREPPRHRGGAGDCAVAHDIGTCQESGFANPGAAEWWDAPGVLCLCAGAGRLVRSTVGRCQGLPSSWAAVGSRRWRGI